jgi:hypothetical protein
MTKNRQWYLSWQPGATGYDHDDIILAVGVQCARSAIPLQDVLYWLGAPDRVTGNPSAGHLAYFFDGDVVSAAFYDVVAGHVNGFGTITRNAHNTQRKDEATGKEASFNILDEMESFTGSGMEAETERGAVADPRAGGRPC